MLQLNWKTRQGTQETAPAVLDLTSSPSTIYLRKNIKKATETDSEGSTHGVFIYDECEIARADYEKEPAAINEIAQLIEQAAASEAMSAELLLNQIDTSTQLDAQDEALADIMLTLIS